MAKTEETHTSGTNDKREKQKTFIHQLMERIRYSDS